MFILDAHCDTPSQIYRQRDLSIDNRRGHVDFPKLKRGDIGGSVFALYIPPKLDTEEAFAYAKAMLERTMESLDSNSAAARFTTNTSDALLNRRDGLVSVFLSLENASPIGTDIERFHWFRSRGVRFITLCHNADNMVCDSAAGIGTNNGLSPFGRELVKQMNRSGVVIDCAHISDKAFWDVIGCSDKPIVSTHSCCRALSAHRRNMTDDMIKAMAEKGGVININFYPVFLDAACASVLDDPAIAWTDQAEEDFIKDPANPLYIERWNEAQDLLNSLEMPSYTKIADHIDHVAALVGTEHIGIGSDFDGIGVTPAGLENISKMGLVFDELRKRGYSEKDIEGIAGGNLMRVMDCCGVS